MFMDSIKKFVGGIFWVTLYDLDQSLPHVTMPGTASDV